MSPSYRRHALVVGVLAVVMLHSVHADYRRGMNLWDQGQNARAVEEFRRAAERGDSRAQDQLGVMYEEGEGVGEDARTAAFWYAKAANGGYPPAQLNLARLYRNGRGVAQDSQIAVHWYKQAAEGGLAIAQFFLGLMYDTAKGVPRNPTKAYMWFSLAARQGDQDAALKRDRLEKQLNDDELKKARLLGSRITERFASQGGFGNPANTRPWAASYDQPEGAGLAALTSGPSSQRPLVGNELIELQRRLLGMGFKPGLADGLPGPKTEDAVRQLERRQGVPITGALNLAALELARAGLMAGSGDPRTAPVAAKSLTKAASPPINSRTPVRRNRLPSNGPDLIRQIQRQLAWLGFDPGPIDGLVGGRTKRAARDYNIATGRGGKGKLNPDLLRALQRTSEERASASASATRGASQSAAPPVSGLDVKRENKKASRLKVAGAKKLPLAPSVPTKQLMRGATRKKLDPFKLHGAALVREFQRELTRLGFVVGAVDGVIGKRTVNAAKVFQGREGLRRTGRLTPALLQRMQRAGEIAERSRGFSHASTSKTEAQTSGRVPVAGGRLANGVTRDKLDPFKLRGAALVREFQRELTRLGFVVGAVDGVIGKRTVNAAKVFQGREGLRRTGRLTPALLQRMQLTGVRAKRNEGSSRAATTSVMPPSRRRADVVTNPARSVRVSPRRIVASGKARAGGSQLVLKIQQRLQRLGYSVGEPDGIVGSRTVGAARRFQRSIGRRATGVLGDKLRRQLDVAIKAKVPSRATVRRAQVHLNRLGFQSGKADGLIGRRTKAAVRAYQHSRGAVVDGRITPELLGTLSRTAKQK